MDEDLTMLIGPASDGALLEIGVLDLEGDDPVIIHAMPQLYVLFNALETEAHRLGDLVNAAQPQTRRGSLFARADRSAVELEARVSTTLRITRGTSESSTDLSPNTRLRTAPSSSPPSYKPTSPTIRDTTRQSDFRLQTKSA